MNYNIKKLISKILVVVFVMQIFMVGMQPYTFTKNNTYTIDGSNPPSGEQSSRYIIKYKDNANNLNDKFSKMKGKQVKKIEYDKNVFMAETYDSEIKRIENDPDIEYVEKDSVVMKSADTLTWNVQKVKADLIQASPYNVQGSGIKVAVFDTGITNNIDLYVEGGASFVDGVVSHEDDNGHGTQMSNILAAKINDVGYIGVAPSVNLFSVKVLDKLGSGYYSNIIQGIQWAENNDIKIIAMFLGGLNYSKALEDAINDAYSKGILIISSAGNEGTNQINYPAAYPNVISVGAVDNQNVRATFSNTGDRIDLVAPGVDVQTINKDNSLVTVSGTSSSASHVAGVAAQIWSTNTSFTNDTIKTILKDTAVDLGDLGKDNLYGYGLVDAQAAYNYSTTFNQPTPTPSPIPGPTPDLGVSSLYKVYVTQGYAIPINFGYLNFAYDVNIYNYEFNLLKKLQYNYSEKSITDTFLAPYTGYYYIGVIPHTYEEGSYQANYNNFNTQRPEFDIYRGLSKLTDNDGNQGRPKPAITSTNVTVVLDTSEDYTKCKWYVWNIDKWDSITLSPSHTYTFNSIGKNSIKLVNENGVSTVHSFYSVNPSFKVFYNGVEVGDTLEVSIPYTLTLKDTSQGWVGTRFWQSIYSSEKMVESSPYYNGHDQEVALTLNNDEDNILRKYIDITTKPTNSPIPTPVPTETPSTTPTPYPDANEPNDTPEPYGTPDPSSTPAASEPTNYYGSINNTLEQDDIDYFKLYVSNGFGHVNISLSQLNGNSYNVQIFDSNNKPINVDSQTFESDPITFTKDGSFDIGLLPGNYYVAITSETAKPWNIYNLGISFDSKVSDIVNDMNFDTYGVYAPTGNYSRFELDINQIDSTELILGRFYNSLDTRNSGVLGRGWTFGLEGKIQNLNRKFVMDDGTVKNDTDKNRIAVYIPGSGAKVFEMSTAWIVGQAIDSGITFNNIALSGALKLTDNQYLDFTGDDRLTYRFNLSGQLIKVMKAPGHVLYTISYQSGKIYTILTENSGHVYKFDYASPDLIYLTYATNGEDFTTVATYTLENGYLVEAISQQGEIAKYEYNPTLDVCGGILIKVSTVYKEKYLDNTISFTADIEKTKITYYTNSSENNYGKVSKVEENGWYTTYDISVFSCEVKTYGTTDSIDISGVYEWDYFRNITKIDDKQDKSETTYLYNYDDKTVTKSKYKYDSEQNIIFEDDISYTKYIYPNGSILISETGFLNGSKTYYLYHNGTNNIYKEIFYNELTYQDEIKKIYNYDTFGNIVEYKVLKTFETYDITTYKYKDEDLLRGLVWEINKSNGEKVIYTYDQNGKIVTKTDHLENGYIYEYEKGNLIKEIDPLGNETTYTYDDSNRILTKVSPNHNLTKNEYDSNGNLARVTEYFGDGENVPFDTTKTKITRYVYDSKRRLVKTISPNNYSYNPKISIDDENFLLINGYESTTKMKASSTTYDDNNNVLTTTDELGNTTSYIYDEYGNMTKKIEPNGAVYIYTYQYTEDGLDPEAPLIEGINFTTNSKYNLVSISFADSIEAEPIVLIKYNSYLMTDDQDVILYDNQTELTYSDATKYSNKQTFKDGKGRVVAVIHGDNSIYTTYEYNPDGTIAKEQVQQGFDFFTENNPENIYSQTLYKYDSQGRQIAKYVYTGQSNVNGKLYSYTGTEYDSGGRVVAQIVCTQPVNDNYIPTENIITTSTTFKYVETETGRILSSEEINGITTKIIEYDKNGRVIKEFNGEGFLLNEYTYDPEGNVINIKKYSNSYDYIETKMKYNQFGKPIEVSIIVRKGDLVGNSPEDDTSTELTTYNTYDPGGNLIKEVGSSNIQKDYIYDETGKLIAILVSTVINDNPVLNSINQSEYDSMGNVTFEYDTLGRTKQNIYDKKGNLTGTKDYNENKVAVEASTVQSATYYDYSGRKVADVSANNYDASLQLSQMNRTEYVYDFAGRVKLQKEVYVKKQFNTITGLWEDVSVTVVSHAYKYDNLGNVIKELDALGFASGEGSTDGQKINSGYGTQFTYDAQGHVLTVLTSQDSFDNKQFTQTFTYDALGNILTETNQNGVKTNVYDLYGRISTETNEYGITWSYFYDSIDNIMNVISTTISYDGGITQIPYSANTYDLQDRLITNTDSSGSVVTYQFNSFGQPYTTIYANGYTEYMQYDAIGNLAKKWDTYGTIDIYLYDSMGVEISHTQGVGVNAITTSTNVDIVNSCRTIFDGNGNAETSTIDASGRIVNVRKTTGSVTKTISFTYDNNGNQLTIHTEWTTGYNYTTSSIYDSINRLIQRTDNTNIIVVERFEYNDNNQQIYSYDAYDNKTTYVYDRNNRLIETIDPAGHYTKQTYDANNNIKTKTDGNNNTTEFTYDFADRLINVKNANDENTSYTYDIKGNKLSQIEGNGNTVYFEYNNMNQVSKKIYNGGRTGEPGNYTYDMTKIETFTYYSNGLMQTSTDRNGNTTTYNYDVHNRLLNKTVVAGGVSYVLSLTYDNNGNILTETNSQSGIQNIYQYDAENRKISMNKIINGINSAGALTYSFDGYDSGLNATVETSSGFTGTTTKKYDVNQRLITVEFGGKTTTYSYYADGKLNTLVYASGAKEEYTYTSDRLLSTLTNKMPNGTVMDSYVYTYDNAHNQLNKTETINGVVKGTTYYTYDSLNRLIAVQEPVEMERTTTYTFDGAGNRINEYVNAAGGNVFVSETVYNYNSDKRLESTVKTLAGLITVTTEYTYDNNGNQIYSESETNKPISNKDNLRYTVYPGGAPEDSATGTSYNVYDVWNQLISVDNSNGTAIYGYSALGYREIKKTNGAITTCYFDEGKLVGEISIGLTTSNIYGLTLITRKVGTESVNYMYNGHGDVTALIDQITGAIIKTYYYDAFGNILSQTGIFNNQFTYSGYQYDEETGKYYLNARYYDPTTARFMSQDTFTGNPNDPLSLNLYSYVHNEPVMYGDPSGHYRVNVYSTWDGTPSTSDSTELENKIRGDWTGQWVTGYMPVPVYSTWNGSPSSSLGMHLQGSIASGNWVTGNMAVPVYSTWNGSPSRSLGKWLQGSIASGNWVTGNMAVPVYSTWNGSPSRSLGKWLQGSIESGNWVTGNMAVPVYSTWNGSPSRSLGKYLQGSIASGKWVTGNMAVPVYSSKGAPSASLGKWLAGSITNGWKTANMSVTVYGKTTGVKSSCYAWELASKINSGNWVLSPSQVVKPYTGPTGNNILANYGAEFGGNSDTYKILHDLYKRQVNSGYIVDQVLRLAREDTPVEYAQDKIMNELHAGVKYAREVFRTYIDWNDRYAILTKRFYTPNGLDSSDGWNYKWKHGWRVPYPNYNWNANGINSNMNEYQPTKIPGGSYPKNWMPWMYFDGMVIGGAQMGNLALGYIMASMGYDSDEYHPWNDTEGDDDWNMIEYGAKMARQGR